MYSRIRNLREDRDLTQILIKLAKFHKTSVDYLLELTDDKRPYPRKKDGNQ